MGKGDGKGDGEGGARGKEERIAVPAMPLPMAIICCIVNFLLPGFGTMIAGFSVFCCSRNEDMGGGARFGSCCLNFAIGFLQLLLTVLCFIGWIWSCVWGVFFIGMSAAYYHDNPPTDNDHPVTRQPGGQVVTTTVISHGYAPHPGQQPGGYVPPPAYTNQPGQSGPPPAYDPNVAYPPPQPPPGQMYGQPGSHSNK